MTQPGALHPVPSFCSQFALLCQSGRLLGHSNTGAPFLQWNHKILTQTAHGEFAQFGVVTIPSDAAQASWQAHPPVEVMSNPHLEALHC